MNNTHDIAQKIRVVNPHANVDVLYGTYNSIGEALQGVPYELREKGRTVGIIENDSVVEYWFEDGVEDKDLTIKNKSKEDKRYFDIYYATAGAPDGGDGSASYPYNNLDILANETISKCTIYCNTEKGTLKMPKEVKVGNIELIRNQTSPRGSGDIEGDFICNKNLVLKFVGVSVYLLEAPVITMGKNEYGFPFYLTFILENSSGPYHVDENSASKSTLRIQNNTAKVYIRPYANIHIQNHYGGTIQQYTSKPFNEFKIRSIILDDCRNVDTLALTQLKLDTEASIEINGCSIGLLDIKDEDLPKTIIRNSMLDVNGRYTESYKIDKLKYIDETSKTFFHSKLLEWESNYSFQFNSKLNLNFNNNVTVNLTDSIRDIGILSNDDENIVYPNHRNTDILVSNNGVERNITLGQIYQKYSNFNSFILPPNKMALINVKGRGKLFVVTVSSIGGWDIVGEK